MIIVLGGNCGIGKRYRSILSHIGVEHRSYDINDVPRYHDATGIIVATPTKTHVDILAHQVPINVPCLCEKPISLNPSEIMTLNGRPIWMVCNWLYLPGVDRKWISNDIRYDYYDQGRESPIENLAQPLALAINPSTILGESPIFRLTINNCPVTVEDVQRSYVTMISDFLVGNRGALWTIQDAVEMAIILGKLGPTVS